MSEEDVKPSTDDILEGVDAKTDQSETTEPGQGEKPWWEDETSRNATLAGIRKKTAEKVSEKAKREGFEEGLRYASEQMNGEGETTPQNQTQGSPDNNEKPLTLKDLEALEESKAKREAEIAEQQRLANRNNVGKQKYDDWDDKVNSATKRVADSQQRLSFDMQHNRVPNQEDVFELRKGQVLYAATQLDGGEDLVYALVNDEAALDRLAKMDNQFILAELQSLKAKKAKDSEPDKVTPRVANAPIKPIKAPKEAVDGKLEWKDKRINALKKINAR